MFGSYFSGLEKEIHQKWQGWVQYSDENKGVNTYDGTPLKRLIKRISKLWRLTVRPLPTLKEAKEALSQSVIANSQCRVHPASSGYSTLRLVLTTHRKL